MFEVSAFRASKATKTTMYASPYGNVWNVKRNGQQRQTSGRSIARHDGELSDGSDEGGNGSDERENELRTSI